MNRWAKLSQFCLRIVQELRLQRAALAHVSGEFGRSLDTMDRIEQKLDETLASHAQANRQVTALSGEVARLGRRLSAVDGKPADAS